MLISYHAGKPFAVEILDAAARGCHRGIAEKDAVSARVAAGTLTIVKTDPRASWTNPFRLISVESLGMTVSDMDRAVEFCPRSRFRRFLT